MITVATGSILRGDMVATGTMVVDGRIEGRVVCSRLEIGSNGSIQGDVAARELIVAGQIVGQVHAASVTLNDGAFIEGEIHYASLALASGATMTGKAVRAGAGYVPVELSELEGEVSANDAVLDEMEAETRRDIAQRAQDDYPRYQQLRDRLVASR